MHEHFKYVFSLYLVYRPIKASCATVWPNQKVPALLDRKCSQLKFNSWNSCHCPPQVIITAYVHWAECAGGVLIAKGEKMASHFGPKERDCHVWVWRQWGTGLEEKVPSTNPEHSHSGFPYWQCWRRLSTTCGSNPHLMGQQRRDPTHVLLDYLYESGN